MNEIRAFLEHSLLPTVAGLLRVTKQMAEAQSKEHAEIQAAVKTDAEETKSLERAIETLSDSVLALSEPIGQLVNAVNESNVLQVQQNKMLKIMKDTLSENTARLDVINLRAAADTEDPGLRAVYEALKKEGGAV